jgi:hypothetical protein
MKGPLEPDGQFPGHLQEVECCPVIAFQVMGGSIPFHSEGVKQLNHPQVQVSFIPEAPDDLHLGFFKVVVQRPAGGHNACGNLPELAEFHDARAGVVRKITFS